MNMLSVVVASQNILFRTTNTLTARINSKSERGEGVISAAIAVLIMAVIGGAMFLAYEALFTESTNNVRDVVDSIKPKPAG
jgi:hypothetical protein